MTSLEKLLTELETAIKNQNNLNFYEEQTIKLIEIIRVQKEAMKKVKTNMGFGGIANTRAAMDTLIECSEKVEAIARREA